MAKPGNSFWIHFDGNRSIDTFLKIEIINLSFEFQERGFKLIKSNRLDSHFFHQAGRDINYLRNGIDHNSIRSCHN